MRHRFFVDQIQEDRTFLTPEDAHHALKVLRLQPGDEIEIISAGHRYLGLLMDNAAARIQEELPTTEASLRITLFQGLPKGDKMDWIIQKGVEIGLERIVPVQMDRCIVRLAAQDKGKKQARWEKIAREAGKQCGRCFLPEVSLPVSLSSLPALASDLDACIVPWEDAGSFGPRGFMEAHPHLRSLGILIGPEGGITPSEIDFLKDSFIPLTLGPRILRTETAGLAAASAILALAGEMEGCT